ncbi:hypothetical protein FGO68_gene13022 [Halteria grandinella]|uniref:Uncharacterized protein n=1 Tax=Halteria grandinella TaxID=5974 RepID=A0A8J8NTU5_HALGN|nr:hypothetical protein FGO68_gene13022 [Halteria grandinella]
MTNMITISTSFLNQLSHLRLPHQDSTQHLISISNHQRSRSKSLGQHSQNYRPYLQLLTILNEFNRLRSSYLKQLLVMMRKQQNNQLIQSIQRTQMWTMQNSKLQT